MNESKKPLTDRFVCESFFTFSYGLYSTLLFDPVSKIKLFKVKSI